MTMGSVCVVVRPHGRKRTVRVLARGIDEPLAIAIAAGFNAAEKMQPLGLQAHVTRLSPKLKCYSGKIGKRRRKTLGKAG